MRAAGYSEDEIEELLRGFPDPIDTERDGTELARRGLTMGNFTDRRGGSP
jgi:hypothetical protein